MFDRINTEIIRPLMMCATEGRVLTTYEICGIRDYINHCTNERERLYMLAKLNPLYINYLKGKVVFRNYFLDGVMEKFISWDAFYGTQITQLDLIETTMSWADNNSDVRVGEFLNLLKNYHQACPKVNLNDIEETVWHEITKLEVYGNRKMAGYLVLLHGFLRIVIRRPDPTEQERLINLFIREWDYLKLVYSVMIRCIVDCGHKDFAGVANNVRILSRCHPYIHIFYAALSGRFDDLCESGTDRVKLSNHLNKIMEIRNSTTQDFDYLDLLCRILFPDSFQEYLNKNRMPSYDEVVNELKEVKAKVDSMNNQIEQMAQSMVDAVKASIPIKEIEKELLRLSPGASYDVFSQVNSLLIGNKAWMEHASSIKEKILQNRDKPSVQNIVYPQAGSTANVGCQMQSPEFKMIPSSQDQKPALESNKKGEENV